MCRTNYSRAATIPTQLVAHSVLIVGGGVEYVRCFPPTGGGISQGFNDSSQEFFKADVMEHMVREIIQNSLDAHDTRHHDKPVVVRMEMLCIPPKMIGGPTLKPHVESSLERMKKCDEGRGVKFYEKALKILDKETIPVLKITDENTIGLIDGGWDALVHQEGTPYKGGRAAPGGSFGIGKNAPYTVSGLSLVCYSTRYLNKHRNEKFIARCRLVAHQDPDKPSEELQHIGFGNSDHKLKNSRFRPILGSAIPKEFRLPCTGSGIFVVGFMEPDWQKSAKMSVARNFFTAIHERKLQVVVDGEQITNETLNDLLAGCGGDSRQYYELIKKAGEPHKVSGEFGSFELRIATGDETMENHVAYINRRGMLITEKKSFGKNPFCARLSGVGKFTAVVRAVDDKTDMRIRDMEPPNHEAIEYQRIHDRVKRDKVEKGLREIQGKIVEIIKKEMCIDAFDKRTELTELSSILPLISDTGEKSSDGRGDAPDRKIEYKRLATSSPKSFATAYEPDGASGEQDAGSGGSTTGGSTGSNTGSERDVRGGATKTAIEGVRVMRQGNMLRVAFTARAKVVRFAVKLAGEESKREDVIPVTAVQGVSGCSAKLNNKIITVKTARNKRTILDLSVNHSGSYTGYEVVDYKTRGGRQ